MNKQSNKMNYSKVLVKALVKRMNAESVVMGILTEIEQKINSIYREAYFDKKQGQCMHEGQLYEVQAVRSDMSDEKYENEINNCSIGFFLCLKDKSSLTTEQRDLLLHQKEYFEENKYLDRVPADGSGYYGVSFVVNYKELLERIVNFDLSPSTE